MASSFGRGGRVEGGDDLVDGERAVGRAFDKPATSDTGPGQQVGVMFDDGGDDDVVGVEAKAVGEVVDGFGGVAADDRHVLSGLGPPGEAQDGGAGSFVGVRRGARLVAGAAVDAGVPRDEVVHASRHGWQRVRRGRAVEVDVSPRSCRRRTAPPRRRRRVREEAGWSWLPPQWSRAAYENVDGDLVALVGGDVTLDSGRLGDVEPSQRR